MGFNQFSIQLLFIFVSYFYRFINVLTDCSLTLYYWVNCYFSLLLLLFFFNTKFQKFRKPTRKQFRSKAQSPLFARLDFHRDSYRKSLFEVNIINNWNRVKIFLNSINYMKCNAVPQVRRLSWNKKKKKRKSYQKKKNIRGNILNVNSCYSVSTRFCQVNVFARDFGSYVLRFIASAFRYHPSERLFK